MKVNLAINTKKNKSENLQYDTLVCWVARMNDSSTKCLMFQVLLFFSYSDKVLRNYKENNAWNMVDE